MAKAKIMIVEDETVVAKELKIILEDMDYAVTSIVKSGEQAIMKAEQDCPDLILMDIRLKGQMDGIEAAERIRSRLGIPVIFLTAYADEDKLERAKLTMPFGYILKPFQDKDTKIAVEMALYTATVDAKRKRAEEELAKHRDHLEELVKNRTAELTKANQQLRQQIEERKKLEENLIKAKELAEAANIAKSNFLGSMSHELRTPLNHIIGFSEILQNKYFGELNEKQADYIQDILGSGKHLLSLISDILDITQIEADNLELVLSRVNIKDLLENSMTMIREKAKYHRINLEIFIPEELSDHKIQADKQKIKQIMFNLLSNAAKFTPDGGTIRLEAELISGFRFHPPASPEGSRWQAGISELEKEGKIISDQSAIEISVADTGIGIAPEDKEKIFDKFYQVKGGIRDKSPGTGLGLSLTKSLVEIHGGRIRVESEGEGKGSAFRFVIPVTQPRRTSNIERPTSNDE